VCIYGDHVLDIATPQAARLQSLLYATLTKQLEKEVDEVDSVFKPYEGSTSRPDSRLSGDYEPACKCDAGLSLTGGAFVWVCKQITLAVPLPCSQPTPSIDN